jgi:hypothetical protein
MTVQELIDELKSCDGDAECASRPSLLAVDYTIADVVEATTDPTI